MTPQFRKIFPQNVTQMAITHPTPTSPSTAASKGNNLQNKSEPTETARSSMVAILAANNCEMLAPHLSQWWHGGIPRNDALKN